MKRYEVVEQSADVGIRGYGRSTEELFSHMALGLFDLMADVTRIQPMATVPMLVQADDNEFLLLAWLEEILLASQRDQMLFMNCRVHQPAPHAIAGDVTGEVLASDRHKVFREVKAITPHGLFVRKEGDLWTAQVKVEI